MADRDQWTDEQLNQLHRWAEGNDNYGFAVSNPKFEIWLLFHFEDGDGVKTSRDCCDRLLRHLPDYDKGIDRGKVGSAMIAEAIRRAKLRDTPPCIDWPRTTGSTVYRLVEEILLAERDT